MRNAHHVRELVGNVSSLAEYPEIPCSRFKKIRFSNHTFVSFPEWWGRLAQLVARNDQLEEIDFSGTGDPLTLEVCGALVSRPALKQVRMDYVKMEAEHFAMFWNGCGGLRQLILYDTELPCTPEFIEERLKVLPDMEEIVVGHVSAMALLKVCPGLRSFRWQNYDGKEAQLQTLITLLKGQHLRQLESLQVTRADDRRLASCMRAMDHVKDFSIEEGHFGKHVFYALSRHFATLQCVSFPHLRSVSGDKTLTILESCPLLKYICVPKLKASAIVLGDPWVCLNLEKFCAGVIVDEPEKGEICESSRQVFKRLSKLTKLTSLVIGFNIFGTGDSDYDDDTDGSSNTDSDDYSDDGKRRRQGLDLRLESGLGQLCTLKNLELLDFTDTIQDMSAEDVSWMSENWKKLELVRGKCTHHGEYRKQPNVL
ncbi:hypothetical protein BG000_009198 [Podila horticola]|nr:hypothetical protein BG000_009198 [Podila horticola]